jgi:hypothetical protein
LWHSALPPSEPLARRGDVAFCQRNNT